MELRMQMARPHLDGVTQNLQLEMFSAMLGAECTTAVENLHQIPHSERPFRAT